MGRLERVARLCLLDDDSISGGYGNRSGDDEDILGNTNPRSLGIDKYFSLDYFVSLKKVDVFSEWWMVSRRRLRLLLSELPLS